jgi:transcriptional repressor NrdR
MRCPRCSHTDDKVVDSRTAEDGTSIRRRRECLACAARFTTFERVEEVAVEVRKSDGSVEPFLREKVERGVRAAGKGRPAVLEEVERIGQEVEELVRRESTVTSAIIGLYVLDRLRGLDEVAYLRFVSVYKSFENPTDFERELVLLAKVDGDAADNPTGAGSLGDSR